MDVDRPQRYSGVTEAGPIRIWLINRLVSSQTFYPRYRPWIMQAVNQLLNYGDCNNAIANEWTTCNIYQLNTCVWRLFFIQDRKSVRKKRTHHWVDTGTRHLSWLILSWRTTVFLFWSEVRMRRMQRMFTCVSYFTRFIQSHTKQ